MKTNLVSWVYIIFEIFLSFTLFRVIFQTLKFLSQKHDAIGQTFVELYYFEFFKELALLAFYVIGIIWAISLQRRKKWSWYFGFCYIAIILFYFISYLMNLTVIVALAAPFVLVMVLFNIFAIYSLISDKKLFFQNSQEVRSA